MKRLLILWLSAAILSGCTAQNTLPQESAALEGKVVEVSDTSMLLASEHGLISTGCDKMAQIEAGMWVEIPTDGTIMESYPAQAVCLNEATIIKTDEDWVGFYLHVLQDLWDKDEALNEGVKQVTFDLSQSTLLSEAEKEALVWLSASVLGVETNIGTYRELVDAGVIDENEPRYEEGLLIELKDGDLKADSFTFTISKWRSALGAYGFSDCHASKQGTEWQYTIGNEFIS